MAGRTKPGRESTVDATEVARFSALAAEWWDARGKMAARLRAEVVGADPSQTNIQAAKLHAAEAGVAVDHRVTAAEALSSSSTPPAAWIPVPLRRICHNLQSFRAHPSRSSNHPGRLMTRVLQLS